jgi:tRNA-binding EMAP/Myf-like protein
LSLSTVEVEKVVVQGAHLDKIVVGKIEKISAHPNADKLKVCLVDVGDEKIFSRKCFKRPVGKLPPKAHQRSYCSTPTRD